MTGAVTIILSGRSWLAPAAAAVVLIAIALIWAGHRSAVERWVRIGCGLLKLTGVLVLALCLLEPLQVNERARPGENLFALIADNSQSLQIKDAGESGSRGEILRRQLTADPAPWLAALEENFRVRRYLFDSRLQNVSDFSELNFTGRSSSLENALQTAVEHWRGQPVAGALLFTDGNATDLAGELPALDGCPPIYPVVLGKEAGLQDISIGKVTTSQTAFEDAPVTVQAQVNAHGFAGSEIIARLTDVAVGATGDVTNPAATGLQVSNRSQVVSTLMQKAGGDDADLNFRFQIQPDQPGLHFYELETRTREELSATGDSTHEATLVNNRQMIVVDRGQEPFRVLYVGGRPNWEYKFLNRAIQDDPQVQMVSLIRVARREPKFEFKGRPGESSNPLFRGFGHQDDETARYDQPVLIRLNTKDKFELRGGFPKTAEELFRYHAVILDHVEAEFFTHDQMALLQRFVSERGGGFMMLGGAESFREGNYADTPIASLLPVYLNQRMDVSLPAPWRLTLTREGWLQPWTRLRATEAEEKERLESMPPFQVLNPVPGIKPGANVLATVLDDQGHNLPALVVQRFGLGQSAAVTIGDLWRWGLRDETMQKDLAKSWRQLLRWLVSDVPTRVSITPRPAVGGNPAEEQLTIKVYDDEFKPLDNAAVKLRIRPVQRVSARSEATSTNSSDQDSLEIPAEAATTGPGTYTATYIPRATGAYAVDAEVSRADGQFVGRAATGWTSDPATEEFQSLKPNRALLETLARRTGGEIVAMKDLDKFVRQLPARHAPVTETWNDPLWHKPAVLLFVLGCFLADWGIRRWKGLP